MKISPGNPPEASVFELVGGRVFFDELAERFYKGVSNDPVLCPLYPPDMGPSTAHLAGFLAQYWGGGTEHYSDDRGHPRLRMRHMGFRVGPAERDAWLAHMKAALQAADLPADLEVRFLDYFELAANHLLHD